MAGEIESRLPNAQYLKSFSKKQNLLSGKTTISLDILLPSIFWAENQLLRALIQAEIPVDSIGRKSFFGEKITFDGKLSRPYGNNDREANGAYILEMAKEAKGNNKEAEAISLYATQHKGIDALVKLATVLSEYVSAAEQSFAERQKKKQAPTS